MAKEILLLSDVENLGKTGDIVKVADGYARNYLLPRDLAAPVSPHALRRLEKLRQERSELARLQRAEAQAKSDKLLNSSVTLRAKTVDGTRLYGSIHAADIVAAVKETLGVALDKSQVALDAPLKETGSFTVAVTLHPEVAASLKVWVVEA